jgi:hypothetical protein
VPLTLAPLHRDFDRFKEKVRCQMRLYLYAPPGQMRSVAAFMS